MYAIAHNLGLLSLLAVAVICFLVGIFAWTGAWIFPTILGFLGAGLFLKLLPFDRSPGG